jgi:hypothetical protein
MTKQGPAKLTCENSNKSNNDNNNKSNLLAGSIGQRDNGSSDRRARLEAEDRNMTSKLNSNRKSTLAHLVEVLIVVGLRALYCQTLRQFLSFQMFHQKVQRVPTLILFICLIPSEVRYQTHSTGLPLDTRVL